MMSDRRLRITIPARGDLRALRRYARRLWGKRQRDLSADRLAAAMRDLTLYPDLGGPRDDLTPGLRARVVGEHVVYCRADDEAVTIIRVLHQKMDAPSHLADP